jgi:hypothetical protein
MKGKHLMDFPRSNSAGDNIRHGRVSPVILQSSQKLDNKAITDKLLHKVQRRSMNHSE